MIARMKYQEVTLHLGEITGYGRKTHRLINVVHDHGYII